MRYAELTLYPDRDGFHPLDRAMASVDGLERIAVRQFSRLEDGTVVVLYQLRGDPGPARSVLEVDPDVLAHGLTTVGREFHAFVHMEPNGTVEALTSLPRRHPLVIETPVQCLPDGGFRVGVVGERATFTTALEDIPASVGVELESIRPYEPGTRRLDATLTARQEEVLRAAVEAGYYENPRDATYADVAADLDLAPVTVGEHLRKVEARVLNRIARGLDVPHGSD